MGNQYYPFEQFIADVDKIAKTVEASGKKFTTVYGQPRGGLPLAVCLSHRLNLSLTTNEIFGRFYRQASIGTQERLLEEMVSKVLIVDDISDTGKTLQRYKEKGFFIATLFKHPHSTFEPDIWLHEKGGDWIVFWWESIGPLTCGSIPAV